MVLRKEVLPRKQGQEYEDPDGEFMELIDHRGDKLVVLTRANDTKYDTDDAATDDEDDYPTNDEGEPLCVGKDDGQCSRTVEEPRGVCWQHED